MKALSLLIIISLSSASFAVSKKVCFGSKNNEEVKGVILKVEIETSKIYIKTIKSSGNSAFGDGYYGGESYPSLNETITGRDGKVYLTYKGENTDYQDIIMVDKNLLKKETTGLLQIRARGEGFFNSAFVCKDDLK